MLKLISIFIVVIMILMAIILKESFMSTAEPIQYYRRGDTTLHTETVMDEGWLRWAYQSPRHRGLCSVAFRYPLLSKLIGAYFDSSLSRGRIAPFIEELAIDVDECDQPLTAYTNFNAFFTRSLKPECRPYTTDSTVMVSPADARVLAYPLETNQVIPVKGVPYTIAELLQRPAPEFDHGHAIVFRLCPADYHRFHFPCDGTVVETKHIHGNYDSVNPIALALGGPVFSETKRSFTVLDTAMFGRVAIVEVGAFGVGGIDWTFSGVQVKKMEEKGFFKFGGSTLILVTQANGLTIADDLLAHSAAGYETLLHVGEDIGVANQNQ